MRCLTATILLCFSLGLTVAKGQVVGDCPVVAPRNGTLGLCLDQCQDDADCTAPTQRCCFIGCGHVCFDVTTTTQPPCPEVRCMLACPYGYQQDVNGCATCACINQTVIHEGDCPTLDSGSMGLCFEACQHDGSCTETQKCCPNGCGHQCLEAVHSGNSTKEGQCPVSADGGIGLCIEDCSKDTDCDGNLKCCSNGCGHQCLEPLSERPGTCPVGLLPEGSVGICQELCRHDNQCPTSHKCCSNGCGHACILPLDLPVIHDGSCPALEEGGFGSCDESCVNDGNCSTNQKCCSNGCGHTCMDAVTEPECPSVLCMMWCPHGYQQDSNGCDTCQCNAQTVIHDGDCPAVGDGDFGVCSELCDHDGNCTATQKCCSSGCGHTCMEAVDRDPSVAGCPEVGSDQVGVCVTDCSVHADCSSTSQLCCPNGCGHQCMDSIVVHPGSCPVGDLSLGSSGACVDLCSSDGDCPSSEHKCCSNGCGHVCVTVTPTPDECPVISCRMFCLFGFSKDVNGCDICECYEPPVIHPGTCPVGALPQDMMGACIEGCLGDEDCADHEKCCSNGCGHSCLNTTALLCPDFMCAIYCEYGYQQDQNGCNTCICLEAPEDCEDVFCTMHCPYGFKKLPSGCPFCECQETPTGCADVMCMMFCETGFQRDTDGCEVCVCNEQPPIIRPGSCPSYLTTDDVYGICADMCDNDAECSTNQKCCANSCGGHQCADAVDLPVECPSVHCMMWCPYGYQEDANGCDMCLCNQQTEVHIGLCPSLPSDGFGICSESCEHDGVCAETEKCCPNSCGARQCTPAITTEVKPGTCPEVSSDGSIGVCIEGCSIDSNCTGTMKCCTNGCGHQCMEATSRPVVRPGECPTGSLPEGINGICSNMCQEDDDCGENQKCCSNGCGQVCMTAVAAPDACGDVLCKMFCAYGFQRDALGCEMCVCNDPPAVHSGVCPAGGPPDGASYGICTEMCMADGDCASHQKCCSNGCGHMCMDAVNIPGTCPTGALPDGLSVGVCVDVCQGDHDCDSDSKCCSNGCGHQCLKAVDVTVCPDAMCLMFCSNGFQKDEAGCDICACNTAPVCPDAMCLMFCSNGFQKDEAGCDICVCNTAPVVCLPIMCNMYCDYGFDKDPTTGCDLCSCRQPVIHVGKCPASDAVIGLCGEFCAQDGDCLANQRCCSNGCGHTCVEAIQDTVPKPGVCPAVADDVVGACISNCTMDGDCSKDLKCCSNGCGRTCLEPTKEPVLKPGVCPAVTDDSPSACGDDCLVDADCVDSFKCCRRGCGHTCVKPVQIEDLFGDSGARSALVVSSALIIATSVLALTTQM